MLEVANWIGLPENIKCDSPKFVRKINLDKKIKKATLYITSIGIYECKIDGIKIGEEVLTPGWTNYSSHIQCREYDVTDMLKNGSILEIQCGKGWGVGQIGWFDKDNVYSKRILCKYALNMTFNDGKKTSIVSDENTEIRDSEILFSDIYNGEIQDKTVKSEFLASAEIYNFNTEIIPQMGERIKEQERIRPVRCFVTPKGERIIDFGQNITGYVEIETEAEKGSKITVRHAEILDKYGNFYVDNLRTAKNEIRYVCSGKKEILKPSLSFQGFRYISLDEYPSEIDIDKFTAVEVHSDIERMGNFVCGFDKLNMLYSNIVWGQKDNFLDVPTDCPQRDERLGWTGDAQIFARTAAINFNVEKFFEKWLYDLRSEQRSDGSIPAVVPDCLRQFVPTISAGWGDAAVICPWEMYRAYGNKKILEDNFECMCKWVDYMHKQGEEEFLWIGGNHFGDWLALDVENSKEGGTDPDFIASCYFAYSTSLLIKSGKIIGKDISEYEEIYPKIVSNIKSRFTKDGLPLSRTQTACAMLIHFGLCDNPGIVGNLLVELINERGGRLTTGFLGTPYLLHALSETGNFKTAYDLLLCEGYPSWLYSVNHGATTMWEHWDGVKEDGSFWDVSMNSFNHYAYGSVYDWMFKYIGGIDIPSGGEGYRKVVIAPVPDKRLGFAENIIKTKYGQIRSAWRYREDFVRYEIEIPEGVSAHIKLVNNKEYYIAGGKHIFYTEA